MKGEKGLETTLRLLAKLKRLERHFYTQGTGGGGGGEKSPKTKLRGVGCSI